MSRFTQLDELRNRLFKLDIPTSVSNDAYFGGKNQQIAHNVDGDKYFSITYNSKGTNAFTIIYGILGEPMWDSTYVEFKTVGETLNFIKTLKNK